jgi:N-hydroxyarylamine O-acetyltransferase
MRQQEMKRGMAMSEAFRLDRYLKRIAFEEPTAPDLKTLTALHAAHTEAIPFEGLDPLLRRPVKLDLGSLQEKLIDGRRGGYCFEQNVVFKAALEAIGFKVAGLGGRVRWMSAPDSPLGPRTHMALKVDLPEGPFLADVGFGAYVMDKPLQLTTDIEQHTAMGTFRLAEADGLFWLSARQPSGWRVMYAFGLEPQIPSDYELGNWYASTSPLAPFTSILIMERVGRDKRYKLVNRRYVEEARDGEPVYENVLQSAEDFGKALHEKFGITPPDPADELFARIPV